MKGPITADRVWSGEVHNSSCRKHERISARRRGKRLSRLATRSPRLSPEGHALYVEDKHESVVVNLRG